MDSFKRTLRRRLIWLFVIVVCVLLYADVSDAKGGGGHGGGGRSSSASSHASSHSSNSTARASVAQSTATKAAVAVVESVQTLGSLSRGRVLNSGIHKTCVSQGSVVVVRSGGKIVEKCPEK